MKATRGRLILSRLMILIILAGCWACAGANALDASEEVQINIVGGLKNFEGLEAVIMEFEKEHRNCVVFYEYLDDYTNTVVRLLENNPENTQLFLSYLSVFTQGDIRRKVSIDYADANSGVDYSQVNSAVTSDKFIDGKLYTVPLALNPRGMMVNVDLLRQYGIELPATYDEFIQACETLKANGLIPLQGFNKDFALNLTIAYAMGTIAKREDADAVFSELNAWTPGSGKYFQKAFDIIDTVMLNGYADYAENDKQIDGYESSILNFLEGDVAFFPCSSETFSGVRKRESKSANYTAHPFEYVFSSVPLDETGGYIYWQSWQGISVNETAENVDWARAFADFLFKKENMALLADIKGMVPNTNEPGTDDRYLPLYSVPDSNIVVADKVSQQVVEVWQEVLQEMTLSPDSPLRLDAEAALLKYEELIERQPA